MEITAETKIHDLLQHHPALLEYLAGYQPELAKLRNPLLRSTLGRVATLETAAQMAGVPVDRLVADLRAQAGAGAAPGGTGETAGTDRVAILKDIVLDLHRGQDFAEAKRRFGELVEGVDHAAIAAMEQQLIHEGLPEAEVKRLCDVHVALVKESLEAEAAREQEAQGAGVTVPPGHPVHTFRAENEAAERLVGELRETLAGLKGGIGPESEATGLTRVRALLDQLAEVELHYLRKENQLFPALEAKGFEGPTKVMWAIHDDIRDLLKAFRAALGQAQRAAPGQADLAALKETGGALLTTISDMVYKEERILFPSALDLLEEQDWSRIRQGEDDVGYAFGVRPRSEWRYGAAVPGTPGGGGPARLPLDTGFLTVEQVNLLLRHLPLDVSFVDEHDEVRYYSEGERVFPRSPGVIGRKVLNCHPPKSVATVQKIVDEFKAGAKDVAEFWLTREGKFVHIRYFAVRDREGRYRGVLEVVQDVTHIRELTGERRLLDW